MELGLEAGVEVDVEFGVQAGMEVDGEFGVTSADPSALSPLRGRVAQAPAFVFNNISGVSFIFEVQESGAMALD